MQSRLILFAASAGIAALTIYLLISGRNILIPIAIAVMAWYLINAIARGIMKLSIRGVRPPRWAALALTALAVIAAVMSLAEMVSGNFSSVVDAIPTYQANLQRLIGEVSALFGLEKTPNLTDLVDRIDFRAVVSKLAATLTGIAGEAGLIPGLRALPLRRAGQLQPQDECALPRLRAGGAGARHPQPHDPGDSELSLDQDLHQPR